MNWRDRPYLRNYSVQLEGRSILAMLVADGVRRLAARQPICTMLHGVPDTSLFQSRFDTMAEHVDGMRCTQTRNVRTHIGNRQGACWTDPAVPERCTVTTWRA